MLRHKSITQQTVAYTMIHSWWPMAIVLIAGIALSMPLWRTPYLPYAHDSLPHIFNLFALDRQIESGTVYPLRFPELGYGYGYAVLSYYPPLGYYMLELWHLLGANYVVAYKIGFTLTILGAGLASYGLGKSIFNRGAGVIVSLVYVYNPYFLSNIYIRAAFAELLGLAVAPLAFLAVHRAGIAPGWRSYLLMSLALALLILTHPLSTLLFAAFLIAYALLVLFQADASVRGRVGGELVAGGFTAVLATSFYWLPARLEAGGLRVIDPQVALTLYLNDLKPLREIIRFGWATALPLKYAVATFSIAVPILVGMSLIYFVLTRRQRSAATKAQFLFFVACMLCGLWFMSTSASQVWQHFPLIRYEQFTFRWFGPVALFTAVSIGGSFDAGIGGRASRFFQVVFVAMVCLCIVTSLVNLKVIPARLRSAGIAEVSADDINESGVLASEHDMTDFQATYGCWVWAHEYIPSTSVFSDCARFADTMLNDTPMHSTLATTRARVIPSAVDENRLEAQVSSPAPWTLSLHAYWIPGWTATIDGKPARTSPTDAIGVVGVGVPAGKHRVRLAFGPTLLRVAAIVISLLALVAWLALAWWRDRRLAALVSVVLLIMVGLVGGRALRAPAAPAMQPLDVNLGNKIGLQGFALAKTDDTLAGRLVWLAREPMAESYKVFIHVIDDQGKLLAQVDSRPQGYASNTNRWIPGQVVADRFEVPLPPDTPPGRFQVRVGLYNEADGQRLPVLDASGKAVDDQVLLGYADLP